MLVQGGTTDKIGEHERLKDLDKIEFEEIFQFHISENSLEPAVDGHA